MAEPLSYKELENLVKNLQHEKQVLTEQLVQKESQCLTIEELYKQIVDHVKVGVFLIQGETFRFINQEALRMLDANKKDLEAINFSEIVHPDFRGDIIQDISEIIESKKEKTTLKCKLVSLKGRVINVELEAEKLPGIQNQSTLLVKVSNADIYIQQEQLLKNLKQRLNLVKEAISVPYFVLQNYKQNPDILNWQIVEFNAAAETYASLAQNNIEKYTPAKLFEIDQEIKITDDWLINENQEYEVFVANLKKYCRFEFKRFSDTLVTLVITDIHDLVVTKKQLTKNLQRNELFAEVLRLFNYQEDYDKKFQDIVDQIVFYFNPRQVYIFEHNKNATKARILAQYSDDSGARLSKDYELPLKRIPSWITTLKLRKMMLGYKLDYLPADVKLYLENLNFKNAYIFPILVEDEVCGSILFENQNNKELDNIEINYLKIIAALISGLASQKLYEQKMENAKNEAVQADRLKSSFLASMSHDIRIPMTAIIGFSDLLVDPDLTIGEREEFVELISKSGQDLLTLVDNIVDVAKIETGQLNIQKDTYSVAFILKELLSDFVQDPRLVDYDEIELILDLPKKYEGLEFETDLFRFKQIFSNLIDNAIKFTDKGVIHFGISSIWDETIEFYVQDTGIGIAEETQQLIFERFGKIDRSYTKEYSGTGLGLSICKSLVELMGGKIRVISYPGKGSTFYFTHEISKKYIDKINKKEYELNAAKYNWSGKTILVVEDVEQNYKIIAYALATTQAKIVWKKDGRQAVNYITEGNPADVILMDIRMPVLNGIEATKEILKIKNLPIIAQTAYTLGVEKQNALDVGCVAYLTKPINAKELIKTIAGLFSDTSIIEK